MERKDLPVYPSTTLRSSESDLGAKIMDGTLYIPDDVYRALDGYCENTQVLLSALQAFPNSFARILGWQQESLVRAYNILLDQVSAYDKEQAEKYRYYKAQARNFGAKKPS